jgi:hypothetical protein
MEGSAYVLDQYSLHGQREDLLGCGRPTAGSVRR